MNERLIIAATTVPELPRHVKLKHDQVRDRWIMQAPERVLVPDDTALEIVKLLGDALEVDAIVDRLVEKYAAPRDLISNDVIAMLQDLADKGFVVDANAA